MLPKVHKVITSRVKLALYDVYAIGSGNRFGRFATDLGSIAQESPKHATAKLVSAHYTSFNYNHELISIINVVRLIETRDSTSLDTLLCKRYALNKSS